MEKCKGKKYEEVEILGPKRGLFGREFSAEHDGSSPSPPSNVL